MTLDSAKNLQKRMPYKRIYFDATQQCYRLINPSELYEYTDEEGTLHVRANVNTLVPIFQEG